MCHILPDKDNLSFVKRDIFLKGTQMVSFVLLSGLRAVQMFRKISCSS